jgi:DNA replication and repair protein RecF
MLGRSFRPSQHQDLIKIDAPSLYLEALFCKHGVDQKLRISTDGKERKMTYNSTPLSSLSNLLGLIQGVIMTPDDVSLIKGSPAIRRQFLDVQIAQVDPLYVHYLTRYVRAMRQRNVLLRQKKKTAIEGWEHEMALASGYIVMQRRHNIHAHHHACQLFYTYLTEEKEHLTLEYRSGASSCQSEIDIREYYLKQFHKNRERELVVGYTLTGPHKDDIQVEIGGRDARIFASEGQQRSCVTALHVGEWQHLKQIAGHSPLFMVDDVGISLDDQRRERLMSYLTSMGQVFLTTTDPHLLDSYKGEKQSIALPLVAA